MQDDNFYKMSDMAETDIKDLGMLNILLCYLLYKIDKPIELDSLYDIAINTDIITYFFYIESIEYLIKNELILIDKNENRKDAYFLLDKGRKCAKEFNNYVPKTYRDKIMLAALKYFADLKKEQEIIVEYIPLKRGGYYTHVRCLDIYNDLLELKLYAPDLAQAKLLGERIMKNPAGFYSKIIEIALSTKEIEFDLSDN